MQAAFFGTAKQSIVDLIPTNDEYHLLVGLKDEKVLLKKTGASRGPLKKCQGGEKTKSSFMLDDVFNVDYETPLTRGRKYINGIQVLTFCALLAFRPYNEENNQCKGQYGPSEKRLGQSEWSYSSIHASIRRTAMEN